MVDLLAQLFILLLQSLVSLDQFYKLCLISFSQTEKQHKTQTLDPGFCIRKSGPLSLNPPLYRPHQLPSGSRRHLTPLETLLPRHQGRVRGPHPIKHIPRQERISVFFLHWKKPTAPT